MKVKIKHSITGKRFDNDGNELEPFVKGAVVEVPDSEGADLCAAGNAEPVGEAEPEAERAVDAEDSEKR